MKKVFFLVLMLTALPTMGAVLYPPAAGGGTGLTNNQTGTVTFVGNFLDTQNGVSTTISSNAIYTGALTNTGNEQVATFNSTGNAVVAGTLTANGVGVTNVWVREILAGADQAASMPTANTDTLFPLLGVRSGSTPDAKQAAVVVPYTGYLSNFNACVTFTFPAGTNVLCTIQTNAWTGTTITAPVDTSTTVTFLGGGNVCLSDSTHAIPCTASMVANMRVRPNAAIILSGNTNNVSWTIEWWHQSP